MPRYKIPEWKIKEICKHRQEKDWSFSRIAQKFNVSISAAERHHKAYLKTLLGQTLADIPFAYVNRAKTLKVSIVLGKTNTDTDKMVLICLKDLTHKKEIEQDAYIFFGRNGGCRKCTPFKKKEKIKPEYQAQDFIETKVGLPHFKIIASNFYR